MNSIDQKDSMGLVYNWLGLLLYRLCYVPEILSLQKLLSKPVCKKGVIFASVNQPCIFYFDFNRLFTIYKSTTLGFSLCHRNCIYGEDW